jgi:tetratricopeptide (TPR) repeat protein
LSKPPKASAPQMFYGREAELSQILEMVSGPRPARIAILGPGGYGKTTLACAVLAHRSVRERFGEARYFVACESATTSGDLLIELAKGLGLLEAGSDAPWPYIKASLTEKECIICLDNFESPWDQAAEIRNSVEVLLSKITSLRRVTVLVTMRGTERPGQTHWTQPALAPLKTLDNRAAQVAWQRISNNFDDFAEQLIAAVDNVPLAVNVLAHLAQATSPALLWKEWKEKFTGLVQRGHSHKLSNLEYSIELSLNSKRMRDNPSAKELLGVLSVLPDGIHKELLDEFNDALDIDILLCLRVLQQCSLIEDTPERYQSHSIIRHFCCSQGLLLPKHEELLNNHYIALAMMNRYQAGSDEYAEMVLETNNTRATLSRLLKSNYQDQSKLVNAVMTFVKFCMNIGDYSDQLLDEAVKFVQQNNLPISLHIGCLQCWGRLYYRTHDLEKAKLKLQEAKMLCTSSSDHDNILHAKTLRDLGDIFLDQDATSDAEAVFQEALRLYKAANDVLGQGNCYSKLGGIYIKLKRLPEAGAAYSGALEFHKTLDDNVGQASDYRGLGDMQLQLKSFKNAQVSYQMALEFDKAANSIRGQAKDYKALGNTHLKNKELDDAEASFEKALGLYKAINSSSGQGNILYDLAKIYLKRSQLKEAKSSIEMALDMHKQAQDKAGEKQDQCLLKQILSKGEVKIADKK